MVEVGEGKELFLDENLSFFARICAYYIDEKYICRYDCITRRRARQIVNN